MVSIGYSNCLFILLKVRRFPSRAVITIVNDCQCVCNVGTAIPDDDDRTLPVTADMLDGATEKSAPVVGWLVCTEGVNKGTDYRLHQGRNFVGRSSEMDVCILGDNTVSRSSHAIVVYDPRSNVYLAQPGSSKELFYVNDKLVLNPIELKAMDQLSIGDTKLMFVPLCSEKFHW